MLWEAHALWAAVNGVGEVAVRAGRVKAAFVLAGLVSCMLHRQLSMAERSGSLQQLR